MVDCCATPLNPMYRNGHPFPHQPPHYHLPHPTYAYPPTPQYTPPEHDFSSYERRVNAYCGIENVPLNRNNNNFLCNNYPQVNNAYGHGPYVEQCHSYPVQHMSTMEGGYLPDSSGVIPRHYYASDIHINSSNPTRESRNRAEKQRRDKMLGFVHELGRIVPLVSQASAANKRTDRTGILRLTASFIRIETQLKPGLVKVVLPSHLRKFDWERFLLEHLESILLVVSGNGKIVFVSNTVKNLLGHDPLDMMGRQLSDYTKKEDCDELNKQLKINPDENTSGSTTASSANEVTASDDSSDSSTNCSGRQSQGQGQGQGRSFNLGEETLARSFELRISRGPKPPSKLSKNDKLDFQTVHVCGHLRLSARGASSSVAKRNRNQQPYSEGDVFLVALVRPAKERILNMGEFNVREEYITRHHIDGRIIYTDHRISMVAGYLPGEVTGTPGFKYMHKDDVMWTMIALQQMFYDGKRIGNSCYKMLTKNGKFIFMRTHGYLELADDNATVESFVCINTVITQQEFDKLNKEMKENFSPIMNQKRNEITNSDRSKKEMLTNLDNIPSTPEVEDPIRLQKYIKNILVEGIKSVPSELECPKECEDIKNYLSVVTKNIPPVSYLNQQMNYSPPVVKVVKGGGKDKDGGGECPSAPASTLQQQRPSVLRRIVSARESTTSVEGCSVSKRMRTEVPLQEARATVLMSPCQAPKPPPPVPLSPPPVFGEYASAAGEYASATGDAESFKLLFNAADYPPFDASETSDDVGELVGADSWLPTPTNLDYDDIQIVEGLTKTQSHLEHNLQKQSQSLTEITENLDMIQPSELDEHDFTTIVRLRGLTETTTQQLSEQEVTLRDLQRDTQSLFLQGRSYPPSRPDPGDLQFFNVDDKYL